MGWYSSVSAAIGVSHIKQGKPCQDFGGVVSVGGCIAGVISDGAGSAKYSHIGSRATVERALDISEKWIHQKYSDRLDEKHVTVALHKFSEELVNQLVANLHDEARKQDLRLRDLSCTLVFFLSTPRCLLGIQIGDGFLVTGDDNTNEYRLLFSPDKGDYANETVFLTTEGISSQAQVLIETAPVTFIAASTDGLERVAIDFRTSSPSARFFDIIRKNIVALKPLDYRNYLDQFLNSPQTNSKVDDDKSILVCYLKDQSPGRSERKITDKIMPIKQIPLAEIGVTPPVPKPVIEDRTVYQPLSLLPSPGRQPVRGRARVHSPSNEPVDESFSITQILLMVAAIIIVLAVGWRVVPRTISTITPPNVATVTAEIDQQVERYVSAQVASGEYRDFSSVRGFESSGSKPFPVLLSIVNKLSQQIDGGITNLSTSIPPELFSSEGQNVQTQMLSANANSMVYVVSIYSSDPKRNYRSDFLIVITRAQDNPQQWSASRILSKR